MINKCNEEFSLGIEYLIRIDGMSNEKKIVELENLAQNFSMEQIGNCENEINNNTSLSEELKEKLKDNISKIKEKKYELTKKHNEEIIEKIGKENEKTKKFTKEISGLREKEEIIKQKKLSELTESLFNENTNQETDEDIIELKEMAEQVGAKGLDFEKLKKIKDLGIKIYSTELEKFNNMELDFEKLGKINDLGITINGYNIEKLSNIEGLDFNKLGRIREVGVNINERNILKLNNMKGLDFDKLRRLREVGVNINDSNILELNYMEGLDFEKLGKLKEIGIEVTLPIIQLGLNDNDIEIIKKYGLKEYDKIVFYLNILYKIENKAIKDYIERKQEYLNRNRTISEEKFKELFKEKGKYNKAEINQTGLGLCYMYTGFEILKKSNFFNELIQTNLKETENGWEVRLPMGDKNGKRIKVKKEEIGENFIKVDKDTGEEYKININSETEGIGFKILEIAFMKAHIINCNAKKLKENEYIKKAKIEYQNTGDVKIDSNLLFLLDEKGGNILGFLDTTLKSTRWNKYKKWRNEDEITRGVSDQEKELAFSCFDAGTIKIELGIPTEKEKEEYKIPEPKLPETCKKTDKGIIVYDVKIINEEKYKYDSRREITKEGIIDKRLGENRNRNMKTSLVTDMDGKKIVYLFPGHSYSIEKCYIDKNTGEKRIWIINPHHTGLKYDISLEEAKSIFRWNIIRMNINNMFKE